MQRDRLLRPTHVYVGRDAGGCALALCSDYQDKGTAAFVAEMITGGLTVDRVDWQTYVEVVANEASFMNCCCEPEPELQPMLL